DYVCTKIKDQNGNFITVNYDGLWRIQTVVDTLGRSIGFTYGSDGGLSLINQTLINNGDAEEHVLARFTYADKTIQTNFPGLTVNGPSTIHALTEVRLPDESHYNFDYTSWGQVWKISEYAFDNHLLNYRYYNLPQDANTALTDCPRFTSRRDWAENWNRDTNGNAQEVLTTFAVPTNITW